MLSPHLIRRQIYLLTVVQRKLREHLTKITEKLAKLSEELKQSEIAQLEASGKIIQLTMAGTVRKHKSPTADPDAALVNSFKNLAKEDQDALLAKLLGGNVN